MNTEIAPLDRAHAALKYNETRSKLIELADSSKRITEITNTAGYSEAHRARMELKTTRVEIQRRAKDAREDATNYSRAVIAAERELVAIVEPEEARLQRLQESWDQAREAERQAKIRAEKERVDRIGARILDIKSAPLRAGSGSHRIADALRAAEGVAIDASFAEFAADAEAAKAHAVEALTRMLAEAQAAEELQARREAEARAQAEAARIEAERLAAERAELARQRAEMEAQRRAEEAERQRVEAEERAKLEAERAQLRRQQEEAAATQRAAEAAQREAEQAKRQAEQDARRAELERQREAERAAREVAEAKARTAREEAARAEAARIAAEIESATLTDAAEQAAQMLEEIGYADHIVTRKLRAALARGAA